MSLLDDILNSEAPAAEDEAETLSTEQFATLTAEIEELRIALAAGQQVSLEDSRKIVVWFRARRKKNFTVIKEKAPAAAKAKPATKGTRKKLSAAEQQALADAILNSLP